jgi:hypothetical protein
MVISCATILYIGALCVVSAVEVVDPCKYFEEVFFVAWTYSFYTQLIYFVEAKIATKY